MLHKYRLHIVVCLLIILCGQKTFAADQIMLYSATRNDSPAVSKISLKFNGLPAYRVNAAGQRLDLVLRNVKIDDSFKDMPEDDILVRMEQKQLREETTLSFFLRRPLQLVDSSFLLHGSGEKKSATEETPAQLVLNIHWATEPEKKAEIAMPQSRPAITKKKEGTIKISSDGLTTRRTMASRYSGQWDKFLKEFEVRVNIVIPLRYSLPAFPSVALIKPATESSLSTVSFQALLEKEKTEGWGKVAAELKTLLSREQDNATKAELLLVYGESLLRAGHTEKAHAIFSKLREGLAASPTGQLARYLDIQTMALSGKPYDAAYELSFLQEEVKNFNPLAPYLALLQAEIALATDNIDKADLLIKRNFSLYSGPVRQLFNLRRADVSYSSGQMEQALDIYQTLFQSADVFNDHPFSLARYSSILYSKGDYQGALKQYINLAAGLYEQPEQDLVLYAAAMSQYRSDKSTEAKLLFDEIINKFPDTEAYYRARLKMNDLLVLADLENKANKIPSKLKTSAASKTISPAAQKTSSKDATATSAKAPQADHAEAGYEGISVFEPAFEYEEISRSAPLRDIREEASFKQALTLYFNEDTETSIKLLEEFIRVNSNGLLRKDAEALLVELLPLEIKKMIANKNYVAALGMVDKNRPLLLSGDVNGDFLAELGLAFASLWFWNRAARVYLYMMDIAKDKSEQEEVYLPLLQAFYEKDDFNQVEEYGRRYLKDFANGKDRADIFYYHISALHKNGHTEEAIRLLKQANVPEKPELHALAGKIFFDAGEFTLTEKHLAKIMTAGLKDVDPESVLLRAEAFFRRGLGEKALPYYRHLEEIENFGDQALFRTAQVHLAASNQHEGLKLLQMLVEKANSPYWRRMAEETLATENFL